MLDMRLKEVFLGDVCFKLFLVILNLVSGYMQEEYRAFFETYSTFASGIFLRVVT